MVINNGSTVGFSAGVMGVTLTKMVGEKAPTYIVNDFTTAISSQGNTMTATECWIRPESTLVRIMYIMLN